jgi:hypothetical protein
MVVQEFSSYTYMTCLSGNQTLGHTYDKRALPDHAVPFLSIWCTLLFIPSELGKFRSSVSLGKRLRTYDLTRKP